MIWFYGWCAFIAAIILSVPLAALLDKRAEASPAKGRGKNSDEEVLDGDEDPSLEEAEEAEFADDAELAEEGEMIDEAEEVLEVGEPVDDFEELR